MTSVTGTLASVRPEQPQIEHHRHADEDPECQDVGGLDERIHEERLVQRDAAGRACQPLAERKEGHEVGFPGKAVLDITRLRVLSTTHTGR